MNAHEVFEEVEHRLQSTDPRLDFHAIEAGVQKEEDWWYVPVITQMKGGRPVARDFAINVLAGIESAIYMDRNINVLFVPSQP